MNLALGNERWPRGPSVPLIVTCVQRCYLKMPNRGPVKPGHRTIRTAGGLEEINGAPPAPGPHKFKEDEMTTYQKSTTLNGHEYWRESLKDCPDCGSGDFYEGPSGAGSKNVKCVKCSSKFNEMGRLGFHRI